MAPTGQRRRVLVLDGIGVLSVPAVLIGLHVLLPPAAKAGLAYRPGAITPLAVFTAAFVHEGIAHLLGTLAGYVVVSGFALLVCRRLGERRWFWASSAAIVVGFPILVTWTVMGVAGVLLGRSPVLLRGFWGVVAGLGGLAFVSLLVAVRRRTDSLTALVVGLAGLLVLLLGPVAVAADGVAIRPTGVLLLGAALALLAVVRRWVRGSVPPRAWGTAARFSIVVAAGFAVLGVVGMLPTVDILGFGAKRTMILTTATGFAYGATVAGWGYRYWRRRPSLGQLWRRTVAEDP